MLRTPPDLTPLVSPAASDVYQGQGLYAPGPGTVAAGCGANDALSLPVDTAAAAVTSGSVIGR